MSLKVWLPLNGDLKNIGSSSVIITNNGATVDDSGKIGKCYNFNGSNYLTLPISLLNDFGNEISACAWVNISAWNSQYDSIVKMYAGDNAWKNSIFAMGRNNTTSRLYFSIANGTSSTQASCVLPTDQSLNTWYHVTCVYNNTEKNIKIYLNGDLAVTYNTTIVPNLASVTSIGIGGSPLASYGLKGKLNDVRIYDHALSALEVKEISQALILHYKLDDTYFEATENILPQTTIYTISNSPAWDTSLNGAVMYTPTGWTSGYNGGVSAPATGYHMRWIFDEHNKLIMYSPNKNSVIGKTGRWMGISSTTINLITKGFVAGCKYTISWWQKTSNLSFGAHPGLYYKLTSSGSNGFQDGSPRRYNTLLNTWQKMEITFTMSSSFDGTAPNATVYFYGDGSAEGDLYIKDMQLELKDHSTPYIEGGSTRNLGYIIDSSGYENNGTIIGNVTTNNSSVRYDNSLHLTKGESSYINSNNKFLFLNENPFTISFWANCNDWTTISNDAAAFLMNNWGSATTGGFRIYSSANTNRYRMYWVDTTSTNKSIYFSAANKFTSGWHMLTATFDGSTMKTYCDGVYYTQLANTSFKSLTSPNLYVGNGTSSVTGDYVDFRLYATTLSAEDILKLYQTPTEIDKNGSWHTHEFYENGENFITKTGLIKNSASSEYPFTQHLKYDPEIYFEPDGSVWVHIYHHNNPEAAIFASSNTFANSCYLDTNRWFNATEICNQLNKWEFLIKYTHTSSETESKERWIQSKNPENAVYADVDPEDIIRITDNGYAVGTWGGLYKKNNSAYWVMNSGNSSSWWGATGAFQIYQGGIPGYGGKTVTTTGYNDLYVRIDNIDFDQINKAWITKSNIYLGNSLIEK